MCSRLRSFSFDPSVGSSPGTERHKAPTANDITSALEVTTDYPLLPERVRIEFAHFDQEKLLLMFLSDGDIKNGKSYGDLGISFRAKLQQSSLQPTLTPPTSDSVNLSYG
jgi:hypothetical protein